MTVLEIVLEIIWVWFNSNISGRSNQCHDSSIFGSNDYSIISTNINCSSFLVVIIIVVILRIIVEFIRKKYI